MKLFYKGKDGGPESNVTGYWLIEWKPVFSIALLNIKEGSREAYHSHAFHALSWMLFGRISEERLINNKSQYYWYKPSLIPIFTSKSNLHKVYGVTKNSWVLTFRGPWEKNWYEKLKDGTYQMLEEGRKIVKRF